MSRGRGQKIKNKNKTTFQYGSFLKDKSSLPILSPHQMKARVWDQMHKK
jgi:hypothetical protein